jgi:hypothetical protein
MAPRAYWKGYLKLSLVSCPIALFPATSDREKISFYQLNKKTGHRIKYRKVDAETSDEIDSADRTEANALLLIYRSRSYGEAEWKSVEQRVPITWTTCHLGGRRPWFICSVYSGGRYCGRPPWARLTGNARLRNCPGSLDFLSSRGFLLGCAAISGHA